VRLPTVVGVLRMLPTPVYELAAFALDARRFRRTMKSAMLDHGVPERYAEEFAPSAVDVRLRQLVVHQAPGLLIIVGRQIEMPMAAEVASSAAATCDDVRLFAFGRGATPISPDTFLPCASPIHSAAPYGVGLARVLQRARVPDWFCVLRACDYLPDLLASSASTSL